MLLQHKLSPPLLPPAMLFNVIKPVTSTLNKHHKGFKITQILPSYYYASSDLLYSRHGNSLYITLKIPITSLDSQFKLFQITMVPVPFNKFTSTATQPLTYPDYLGISDTQEYYITLSQHDWSLLSWQ